MQSPSAARPLARPRGRVVLRNPAAGSDSDEAIAQAIEAIAPAEVLVSSGPGDLERLAREVAARPDVDEIVVAGGDGSLNEVINGIAPSFRPRVGLLPAGTGNDLARALGIVDVGVAIEALEADRERRIDVGRADHASGSRYFVNASAGGFSSAVDRRLSAAEKTAFGRFAYTVGAGKALPELLAYRVAARLDAGPALHAETYNFVVSNGPMIAGGLRVAPQARLDDGRLELLLVPALPLLRLAALLARILTGEHAGAAGAIVHRARTIEVACDPGLEFNVDGELLGTTPATFHALPRALRIAVRPTDTSVVR